MDLTATLNSQLTGLQPRLAASLGLPPAAASALTHKVLGAMVRAIGQTNGLGSSEAVWEMCQQFHLMQAHSSVAALTRADAGWPEHRRYLAQTLLGTGRYSALAEHYMPAAPERANDWLGCLALVALATAGQHAAETHMPAAEFQRWLRGQGHQGQAGSNPEPPVRPVPVLAPMAVAAQTPRTAGTAPWWPLAVLALVGVGTSSYFWQQQTAEKPAAPPIPAQVAAAPPRTAASSTVAALVTAAAAPVAKAAAAVPLAPARAVLAAPQPVALAAAKPAVVAKPKPGNLLLTKATGRVLVLPAAAKAPLGRDLPTGVVAPSGPKENTNSTEGLLYKRLANPDVIDRKPIDLDRLSFAPGEAALDSEGAKQLGNIASLLKTFPHYRLIVFGNAEPSEPHSITLALERANTVIAELVKQGIPSTALQAQGHLRSTADKADDPSAKRRPALYISSLD